MAVKKASTKEEVVVPDSTPDDGVKTVTLKSPWGSTVVVAESEADALRDGGFTNTKK